MIGPPSIAARRMGSPTTASALGGRGIRSTVHRCRRYGVEVVRVASDPVIATQQTSPRPCSTSSAPSSSYNPQDGQGPEQELQGNERYNVDEERQMERDRPAALDVIVKL